MAKLDSAFSLADVDASAVSGLRPYEESSSSRSVIVTSARRILVVEAATRRVTRSFTSTEEGETFASPAFVEGTNDGVPHLHCVVGAHLWIWRLDAADLKSGVDKIQLPFEAVDAAALTSDDGGGGVALRSADGRACVVGRRLRGCVVERPIVEIGREDDANNPATFSSRSSSEIVGGRSALLYSSSTEGGPPKCRVFDFVNQIVEDFEPPNFAGTTEAATEHRSFIRRNSVCFLVGGKLAEVRLGARRGDNFSDLRRELTLEKDIRVLWVHPDEDYFFCVSSTSPSLQMRNLKFDTVLASQPLPVDSSFSNFGAVCCLVGDAFCVVDGTRLSSYPFAFPSSSCSLSSNFGKKRSSTTDVSPARSGNAGVGGGWRRYRKRGRAGDDVAASARQRVRRDALVASMKLASSSAEEEAATLDRLRRDDGTANGAADSTAGAAAPCARAESAVMFEALLGNLAESKKPSSTPSSSFWPDRLFRSLMSSSVVNRWDSVIDVLLEQANLSTIVFALRQPGIDAHNLCRLLRFSVSLPDDVANDDHVEVADDETAAATAAASSPFSSSVSSVSKRQLLVQIVSSPFRDEDAKKTLKTFTIGQIVDILEALVNLLKKEEEEAKEELYEDAEEAREAAIIDASSPPLPHAALLRWITLLIDSHFLDFILGDDERCFKLLMRAECFVHEVDAYFQTRDALDGLLGDMRQRKALLGREGTLKTSMGPDDDYCIQIMKF